MIFYKDNNYQRFLSPQLTSDSLQKRFLELSALYNLNKNLNLATCQEELFGHAEYFLKNFLCIKDFCFLLVDDCSKELKVFRANDDIYWVIKDVTFKQGEGISGIAAQTGETIIVQDVSKDGRFLYYKGRITNLGSFMSVPLKTKDNEVIGVLNIHKSETNAFREEEKIFFSVAAQNIANTIERLRLSETHIKEIMVDDITNLFTKSYFLKNSQREFSNAIRYNKNFSIILADIDHFKRFNETYGLLLGDEILKKLAFILKASLRNGDIVCRYGGGEFAILLPETDKDDAVLTSEKLRSTVERLLTITDTKGETKGITITVGTATYPRDGKTTEDILAATKKFLTMGKARGRNKVVCAGSYDVSYTRDVKKALGKNTRSVLSDKEIHALLYKSVERSVSRHKISLKVASDINYLQSIEIEINEGGWKMCTLMDISKTGFKGEIDAEANIDNVYACKAVMDSEIRIPDIFVVRITHTKKIYHNRYQIGAEIINGNDNWARLFALMAG